MRGVTPGENEWPRMEAEKSVAELNDAVVFDIVRALVASVPDDVKTF